MTQKNKIRVKKNKNIENKAKISYKILLSLYLIIPISVITVIIDYLFLDFAIFNYLPSNPFELAVFALLFNIPHIMTSFISYFDKDYIKYYNSKIYFGFFAIALFAIIITYINYEIAALATIFYTMYHVLMQQMGVATVMMKAISKTYKFWRLSAIFIATILYALTFFNKQISEINPKILFYSEILLFILIIFFCISFLFTLKLSKTKIGQYYHISNFLLVFGSYGFYLIEYYFFVILLARFVHDITAFIFYGVHDTNRAIDKPYANIILAPFNYFKIPPYIISPLIGITIAHYLHPVYYHSLILIMIVSFMHYYLEGIMWKKNTIHRNYISFKE